MSLSQKFVGLRIGFWYYVDKIRVVGLAWKIRWMARRVAPAAVAALKRELQEELEYTLGAATEFARFDFDFSWVGQPKLYRVYCEIHVPTPAFRRFVLHETRQPGLKEQTT